MKPKTIPTFNCKSEIIFKDMVSFEKNKVMLKDYAPREFAIYFSKIEGSQGRVVYEMSHPVCECGNKYHKCGVVK